MPERKTFFLPDLPLVKYSRKTMSKLPEDKQRHWKEATDAFKTLSKHGVPVYIVPVPPAVNDIDYYSEYIEQVLGHPDYLDHPYIYVILRVDEKGYYRGYPEGSKYYGTIFMYHHLVSGKKKKTPNPAKDLLCAYPWFQWKGTEAEAMKLVL